MARELELKYARAQIKAVDAAAGTVEAIVSVFDNVDLGGDRVVEGAFTKTLQEWAAKGDPIPVIWSHEWDDPTSHIGVVTEIAEQAGVGLWTRMQLDVEANEKAAYVARLLKQRRVTQFSFGYYTRDHRIVTDPDGKSVRELTDLELFEVGPTLLGMNPATQLLEAASRYAKAGRVLSAKNEEALAQARDLIDRVLVQLQADAEKSADLGTKADPADVADGVFVTWAEDDETMVGRIEHVMTEGVLGVPDSEYVLEATPEDPALLVRIFDLEDDGTYEETEMLMGKRTSEVTVTDAPPMAEGYASKAAAPAVEAEADQTAIEDTGSRDGADNMTTNTSELGYLLTRPKHTEE